MAYALIKSKLDSWYKLDAILGNGKNDNKTEAKANYEIFVAKMDDNKVHLLGYRAKECAYLFPETECAAGDEGIVTLPKNRKEISDLVQGDKLKVKYNNNKKDTWTYMGR